MWGKQDYNTGKGYGIEHIIDGRQRKNRIDGVDFVKSLPDTFERGVVFKGDKIHPNRIYVEDPVNKISIEPEWNNKKNRNWMLTAFKQNKADSKRLASFVPDQNISPKGGSYSTSGLLPANSNIPQAAETLNSNLENISKKPSSFGDWLEELKRKRRLKGW